MKVYITIFNDSVFGDEVIVQAFSTKEKALKDAAMFLKEQIGCFVESATNYTADLGKEIQILLCQEKIEEALELNNDVARRTLIIEEQDVK